MQNTEIAISFVDDQTVQLRMVLGNVIQGRETDRIPTGGEEREDGFYYVDGVSVGRITGRDGDTFMPYDRFAPSPVADLFTVSERDGVLQAIADDPDRWVVTVNGREVGIDVVSRKTNIEHSARVDLWAFEFATVENVFLKLDTELEKGDDIRIRLRDADFTTQKATFDPAKTVSEAIHVNLRGFDPDDAHKVAYLSSWNGWQVDGDAPNDGRALAQAYAAGTDFRVVDNATGRTVLRGEIELQDRASDLTDNNENYFGTNVWKMDFSALDDAGRYHIVVDGVGRSNDFTVTETHWDSIFALGMSGYYHQRSGIALEEPYTDWDRPRSFHPDDGLVVNETTLAISGTDMGYDPNKPTAFAGFAGAMTGNTLDDAWGGWHDAGDWDRRTPHLETVRGMTELWETTTRYQELTSLSIPENGDEIPDILNEALWTLDFFRRLQQDDGGVRGGVESEEHPRWGDGSWNESLRVFAYGADSWTSWEYAAAAAKMSRALDRYDSDLAATYRDSAIAAMTYAERNRPTGDSYDQTQINSRNIAAVEMYALTGEKRWHDLYRQTSTYADGADAQWFEYQHEAAFTYARIDRTTDAALRRNGVDALLAEAETWATDYDQAGYGATVNPYVPYGWGPTMAEVSEAETYYIRAHVLTGDARWLAEAQEDAQYLLGANPANMSYLTGLGGRESATILNVDAEAMGAAPPPGITLYGENSIRDDGYEWYHSVMDPAVWPNFYDIPAAESFNGFENFVPATEYTVMQGMQATMYVTGYLAAQGMRDARRGTDGADTMAGTGGSDLLLGRGGKDSIGGGDKDDRIGGGTGADRISGGAGNDALFGETGADRVTGGKGRDTLVGGTGDDTLGGGTGHDAVIGGAGADLVAGGTGDDSLFGSAGDDRLTGEAGADYLKGEAGRDSLSGGSGADTLRGGASGDTLKGGTEDDRLSGGTGRDALFGGAGDDRLSGGRGADSLTGGTGADRFVFVDGGGRDVIRDFDAAKDRLLLRNDGGPNSADALGDLGTFNADRTTFTLKFSATDVLVIEAATAMTRAAITAAIDII